MLRVLLILLSVIFFFTHCHKNNYDPKPTEFGQNYLPLALGKIFIYKSDSIKYGFAGTKSDGDTIKFFTKDEVISKIEDSLKITYTIARYHGRDTIHWDFIKNHFYSIEKFRVNHNENGLLKTKLVFPVALYYYWNGNQLNSQAPNEFEYSIVNYNFKKEDQFYVNCLKVKMDSINNLRERKITSEIFSQNIGVIYTENINVSLINNDSLDSKGNVILQRPPKIEKGIIFTKLLIKTRN